MLSDNAKELDGELMREICKLLDIEKIRTTVYKPSTNAAVERFHRTLNSIIGKLVEDDHDWDIALPYVMAAYRSSVHEATGYSPNYLILGREVRNPVDLVYDAPEKDCPATYDNYCEEAQNRFQEAYTRVREHLGMAAKRSKRYYDLHVREKRYKVGDWVRYYDPRKRPGKQDKWARKWSGPFLVVRVTGPVNVEIQRSKRALKRTVHIDKLKPYVSDTMPTSWLPIDGDSIVSESNNAGRQGDEADESRQDAEQLSFAQNSPEYDQPSVGERPSRASSFSEYEAVDNLFANDEEVVGESQLPVAGYPPSNPLPYRPRRNAGRPVRYR